MRESDAGLTVWWWPVCVMVLVDINRGQASTDGREGMQS